MSKNHFAGIDIMVPEQYREHYQTYCQTGALGVSQIEENPFPRMIDMWFLSIGIAVHKGLKPEFDVRGPTYKAMEGVVLGSDSWRSDALVLLAIAYEEDIGIAEKPAEMMRIANAYANAGLPDLISLLQNRDGDAPLDFLCEEIEDWIKSVSAN